MHEKTELLRPIEATLNILGMTLRTVQTVGVDQFGKRRNSLGHSRIKSCKKNDAIAIDNIGSTGMGDHWYPSQRPKPNRSFLGTREYPNDVERKFSGSHNIDGETKWNLAFNL